MTTILHVSDTHLGNRQYKSDVRRNDFADAFNQVIDIALGEHETHDVGPVDAVIHTGDLFDDNDVGLDDVYRCQEILQRLSENGIPMYLIIGNHERKLRTQFADLYEGLDYISRLSKEPTMINDDVALYGIDAVKHRSWDNADFTLEPSDDDAYRIVCMHQLFEPPIPNEFIADYDMAETIDRFGIDIDAVALGDYHKRCSANVNGVRVWYPGSTERCAVSEQQARSVDLLTIDGGGETFERQRLELDTRPFEIITITFGEDDGFKTVKRAVSNRDIDGKVAVVRLKGGEAPVTRQQIYSLLDAQGAAATKVLDDRDVETVLDIDVDVPDELNIQNIDDAVDEALSEQDLSEEAYAIEDIVRSDTFDSNIEQETNDYLDTIDTIHDED